MKELFNELFGMNVSGHVEKVRQGNIELSYLSWAWAVAEISKAHDFEYAIKWFDGKPYLRDENLGYMVFTEVTVDGITKEMWLPVMDSHNKAMLDKPYEYKTLRGPFTVPACTMFDINKAIMRCLTKNLAMFGLGLYIYAGEDLPEKEKEEEENKKANTAEQIFELHKKYYNSQTLNSFIKASLNKARTKKITEIPEADLETLMTMIMSSMRTIEEEHKGGSKDVNQGN